ncbi:MAG: aminopeptidase N [Salinarimonas sp.]|nr:aminopeptidase N [Salinarimonas sp.]
MRTESPRAIRLEEYRPSDYLIDRVDLDISLDAHATKVRAMLSIRPNPEGVPGAALTLDGDELSLDALALDGKPMADGEYVAKPDSLTIAKPPQQPFSLTIETTIDPTANTKLMGLYRSNGVYCTQCEAEGFRRITYFLDRPDIMAVYTTRIEADRAQAPILLGNGNPVAAGELPDGRHFSVWDDPHPKPSYLFALVGGNLGSVSRDYVTKSGRAVRLAIYVESGKEERAHYALDALERSMRWDEDVFGREYDLEVFNIVAVSDFNMGAMENKGLNIFNDKYVLASPDTATDADYAHIEAIIAHEYFHNWTGNRITCRDWFQLCLKEGLTVFRDQEFSSDERSRAVERINAVRTLRARQFTEDAGPLAHPVRPREYREINNFYTATVYEKGAEIIRMLAFLLGDDAFSRGMDLYFERHDNEATTVEAFLACFAEVSGQDLSHFALWYEQAGTPRVVVLSHYDAQKRHYRLDFAQSTPATPGQPTKEPLVIPIALGLVDHEGGALDIQVEGLHDGVFVLRHASDSLCFKDVPARPVPSVMRGFSAPVRLGLDLSDADLLTLVRHDSDAFNRWQAGQSVATRMLTRAARGDREAVTGSGAQALAEALGSFLDDEGTRDPAFAALMLTLPPESEIAQEIGKDVDPDAVHRSRNGLRAQLAQALAPRLEAVRAAPVTTDAYSPDAASAGARALRNIALDLLVKAQAPGVTDALATQYDEADNMTDRLAALTSAVHGTDVPDALRKRLLADFRSRFENEPLVIDKWFALQASRAEPGTLATIEALMQDPAFSINNPNRVRALIGAFAMNNPTQFHRADGAGYAFLADQVITLDGRNPQVAARLLTAFNSWRMMEPGRRAKAQAALERVAARDGLSGDVADIVQRTLD